MPDVMIGEMVESRGEGSDRRSAVALVGAAGRSAWRPGFQAAPSVAGADAPASGNEGAVPMTGNMQRRGPDDGRKPKDPQCLFGVLFGC